VPRTALNISFFADYARTLGHHVIDHPEADNHVRYDPAGVAALITPWNGPMMLTSWKLGPALAAGNTVVVKPPEWAPLTCSLLADAAGAAGLPPGVLNVVQGLGTEAGAALIADLFLEKVRSAVAALTVGDPRDAATRVGPLIHPDHFERVSGFVDRAKADGATVLWGGSRHNFGRLYFQPTMFANARIDSEISQEEVFGPVLTWQTFETDDEVIEIANSTRYGLAATLFSRSEARAMRIASAVVAGTVWVNCFFVRELSAPFGGSKISGLGREGGIWSFDFNCDIKNIAVKKSSFS
jgi:acyl-CoA reductase-like NAD-dependent aldehyde dehydrogenase